ncbi:MAG: hypothetical protein DRP12_03105 [Candidatus Aenigmatarchaeota archaeon]|nr:MAG: hypothetical protein DRP12_03105 [Candidatus Aenigmarchaeota archaeon]
MKKSVWAIWLASVGLGIAVLLTGRGEKKEKEKPSQVKTVHFKYKKPDTFIYFYNDPDAYFSENEAIPPEVKFSEYIERCTREQEYFVDYIKNLDSKEMTEDEFWSLYTQAKNFGPDAELAVIKKLDEKLKEVHQGGDYITFIQRLLDFGDWVQAGNLAEWYNRVAEIKGMERGPDPKKIFEQGLKHSLERLGEDDEANLYYFTSAYICAKKLNDESAEVLWLDLLETARNVYDPEILANVMSSLKTYLPRDENIQKLEELFEKRFPDANINFRKIDDTDIILPKVEY